MKIPALLLSATVALTPFAFAAAADSAPRQPWTNSNVKGAPVPPAPYQVTRVFPKLQFARPTSLSELPGGRRMLVTEIGGKIFTFAKSAGVERSDLAIDLVSRLAKDDAGAGVNLWSATLHPKFSENGYLFVSYLSPEGGPNNRVSRFTMTGSDPPRIDGDSERVIIKWPVGPHTAGCILFGTDGMLYIATGDGSGPNPPDGRTTGQDISDLLGSILRIDVDQPDGAGAYSVPADNPFVNEPTARPEVWAYGLRNPWKFGVDRETGDIFAADNGWESWEMVHKIVRGGNCGWPVMEGRAALRTEVPVGPTPIRPPVKDHPHSEANSVIGGPIYRGAKLKSLNGAFVYGDYITGTIWAIQPDADNAYSHATLVDTDLRIVGFGESSDGELFVLDFDYTGGIYELLPSGKPDTSADFPRRLSDTGLFTSLKELQPSPGVEPYTVKVPRWQDGAVARRWIAMPGDGQADLSSRKNQSSQFPDGTVFVKQVELPTTGGPAIRLETQLLHLEDGTWNPYSYLWNDDGSDADLVGPDGADRTLKLADDAELTWHVGAVNECRLCHNAGSNFVLGFVPNQLDFSDQTRRLAAQQVISRAAKIEPDHPLYLVDPHDESQDLNDRARSYLHANCSMCHHPRGNAIVSFYLRRDMPLDALNTNRGTRIGTFGMRNAKVIAAGDPFRSILVYRMSKLGYGRMPYVGSHAIDGQGVALIADWIRSLPNEPDGNSPPLRPSSREARALQNLSDRAALRTLVASTEGSLALLQRMHVGKVEPQDLATAVSLGSQSPHSDIRGLFEHFLPESQRRKRLGPNINPKSILSLQGDRERGKLIYFSDAGRCKACHDFSDAAKSLGPTLAEIIKKYPRRSEMLTHVLRPSLKIDDKFATHLAITDQGRVVSGLILANTTDELRIKTAENRVVAIPRSDVDELRRSPKSLMPDNILRDLTAQEAADLLEYVRSAVPH